MSLKQILIFLVFVLLSIYTAFLNPHDSILHLTQTQTLKLPTVLLLFGSILTGVIITVFLFWTFNLKSFLHQWIIGLKNHRIEKRNLRIETLLKKGENLFICGKTDKAKTLIEKILETSPEHIGALNLMGKILTTANKTDQAEVFYKKTLALEPQNIHALFDLADIYSRTQRQNEEIELRQLIQVMNPGTATPLLRLRDIYIKQEEWKKVCVLQKKILPLMRKNNIEEWKKEKANLGQFQFELGKKYIQEKNRDSAISEFKQALRTNEKCLPAYLALGNAYQEIGKPNQAIKTWKTGFQKTGHKACLVNQQIILGNSDDYQDLLRTYEEALENTEDKPLLVLLLSIFYLERGLEDKALKLLEKNPPENALLHSLLMDHARHSTNGDQKPNFELTRDAVFALIL